MPDQHENACQLNEAEEVFDVVFLSSHESAKVVHPREEPLYFPASPTAARESSFAVLAAEHPEVLRGAAARSTPLQHFLPW